MNSKDLKSLKDKGIKGGARPGASPLTGVNAREQLKARWDGRLTALRAPLATIAAVMKRKADRTPAEAAAVAASVSAAPGKVKGAAAPAEAPAVAVPAAVEPPFGD